MALPALQAAKPAAVITPRWLASLAVVANFNVLPFERGAAGFAEAVIELRRRRFGRGITLAPSFSSALMLRLGGVRQRRGTDTDKRALLLTSTVDRDILELNHRATAYFIIATGDVPADRPIPRLTIPQTMRSEFRERIGQMGTLVGICPGSNAPSRTWFANRFANVARKLSEQATVVVFGAASEMERTREVAGDVAIDMGGKTDLPMLAAGLAECSLVISNDSGPLHLAAAVGTRTVSMWGAGDPDRTGPPAGHLVLRDNRLPCLECVKNVCPRQGTGYFLPEAHMECMQLVGVQDVLEAAILPA